MRFRSRFHAFTLSLCLLAFGLSGCGSSGSASFDELGVGSKGLSGSGGSKPSSYAQAVEVVFRELPEEETTGRESEVRAQAEDFPLIQYLDGRFITTEGPNSVYQYWIRLQSDGGESVAFTPSPGNRFGEVAPYYRIFSPTGLVPMREDAFEYLEIRWSPPASEQTGPVLVSLTSNALGPGPDQVVSSGEEVVVRYDWDEEGSLRLSVAGVAVDTGGERVKVLLPGFRAPYSGLYRLEVDLRFKGEWEGSSFRQTIQYRQKGLTFLEDFPEFDSNLNEPLTIENRFSWDDGSELDNARWRVEVGERSKEGTGAEVLAVWQPQERTLSRFQGDHLERTEGGEESGSEEYTVEASAYAASLLGNPLRYRISSRGTVPSRRGELRIIDEEVLPQPAFEEPGETASLTAQAVLIGSDADPNSIEWTVDLLDDSGEVAVEEFASGSGPHITAEWDGTVAGQSVEHPGAYQFRVQAELCEVPDVGVVFRGAAGQIRAQDGGGECLMAEAKVAVSVGVEVVEVTFGGNQELEATESGPYPVFNYLSQSLYWGGGGVLGGGDRTPQWRAGALDPSNLHNPFSSTGGRHLPVVMKNGSTVHVGAQFLVKTSDPDIETVIVRARAQLNGQEKVLGPSAPIPREQWDEPVVLSLDLASGVGSRIGRHSLKLEWEFHFNKTESTSGAELRAKAQTPTDDTSHRLYTVLGPQPSATKNSSNVVGGEEIWYHPEAMHDEVPLSEPGRRSPLDLATHWASGATDGVGAAEQIAQGLFEDGGYAYSTDTRSTTFYEESSNGAEVLLFSILASGDLECKDGAVFVKTLLGWLGAEASTRYFSPPKGAGNGAMQPDYIFTNYVTMIGQGPSLVVGGQAASYNSEVFAARWWGPKHWLKTLGNRPHRRLQDGAGSFLGTENLNWTQWNLENHMVVEVGGKVVDPVARLDAVNRGDPNPDGILNQMNVWDKDDLEIRFLGTYGYSLIPGALERARSSYRGEFHPEPEQQRAAPFDDYLSRTLYRYSSPSTDRAWYGFNDHDYMANSRLYPKWKVLR